MSEAYLKIEGKPPGLTSLRAHPILEPHAQDLLLRR
jgi:hypothetical protein